MIFIKGKNKVTVPITVHLAETFFRRLRGYMFRREAPIEEGLWIIPCQSIHMFFMHFALDIIFLDKQCRIVKLVEELKPRSFITPVPGAYSVLELPLGTIQKFHLQKGDILNSQPTNAEGYSMQ